MTNTVSRTITDETLNRIIQIESRGDLRAKAPTSSATGLGQFLDATWMGIVNKHRPDLLRGRSKDQVLALRYDGSIMVELLARFTEDNQRIIGMDCTGGDLYLAHFLGTADARDFYRADPSTPADKLVSQQVIRANLSVFYIMQNKKVVRIKTAGEVRAWAASRMNASGGHDWVARYYRPKVVPTPRPDPEPTAEDIPDSQDAPETSLPPETPTVVVPVDAHHDQVEKRAEESAARDAEPSQSWLKRQWKKVTGAAGGFLASIGGFAFDWRLMAVVMISIAVAVAFIIWFMGPGNVRAWIRRQVA